MMNAEFDIAVVGAGLVGCSIAWGLARAGQRVAVVDEDDSAFRASRGNFALIWVQSKGLGMPRYSAWTVQSADAWQALAEALQAQTGLDMAFLRPGGLHPLLSRDEWERREAYLKKLSTQPGMGAFEYEMLDHAQVQRLIPQIGSEMVGASYCPYDGHCNPLRLFRALQNGMQQLGARYFTDSAVSKIEYRDGEFRLATRVGEIRAGKVVLAAGLNNARLGRMVAMHVPVRPQRGHLMVTEKIAPFLHYPVSKVRQTDEGGVMIGDSMEEVGFDPSINTPVLSVLADRAIRMFPQLADINVVRTWACLRVMTQDGFPIYEQSTQCPGAFAVSCHSGVTLAANHAFTLPEFIIRGAFPEEQLGVFSSRRFDVPAVA
jgi:glycine/D-amino acid oxidase-like deaminating enzyme